MQAESHPRARIGIGHPQWNEETSICPLNEHPTSIACTFVPHNGQLLTEVWVQWILHFHGRQVARIMTKRLWPVANSCLSEKGVLGGFHGA